MGYGPQPALAGVGLGAVVGSGARLGSRLDRLSGVLQSKAAQPVGQGTKKARGKATLKEYQAETKNDLAKLPAGFGSKTRTVTESVNGNTATYVVDAGTRHAIAVNATIRTVTKGHVRSSVELTLQRAAAKIGLIEDQGGHLIADRFMPKEIPENLVPQNGHLNNSAWRTMENEWADWTREGMEVHVTIDVIRSDALRPDALRVSYEVTDPRVPEGRIVDAKQVRFDNVSGQLFDRTGRAKMKAMVSR